MSSSYDRARRQQVDPNKVRRYSGHKLNPKAVAHYRTSDKRWHDGDGGDPYVIINKRGVARWQGGAHRGEAARLEGRKLIARVHDERMAGPAQAAGCMGLMLCAAVLVGLVGRRR